jgi:hypothetical protein
MKKQVTIKDTLVDYDPEIRIEGLRGDGSNYPWLPWNENTHCWYANLSSTDKRALKRGKVFKVRSFFCLVEEVRLVKK